MGLEWLFARLRAELESARNALVFAAGCNCEPALGQYESVGDLLKALDGRGPDTYAERDCVIRALVRQHLKFGATLWGTALLLAFAPMLRVLRRRLRSAAFDGGDFDQLVVEGFLVAIAAQSTNDREKHIALRLCQRTQVFVFGRLAAERRLGERHRRLESCVRAVGGENLYESRIPTVFSDDELDELAVLLGRIVGDELPQRKLDVVVATRLRGLSVREHVLTEVVPRNAPTEDFVTLLQRTKREHSRTLRQLRPILKTRLSMMTDGRAERQSDLARAH